VDWDSDGLKDLIVGENAGTVRYYRNIGTVGNPSLTYIGYIQAGGVNIDIGSYSQPWVDDWNEDGMKDLLVGESDGVVNLYVNVGSNQEPRFNAGTYITYATGGQIDFGSRSGPIVVDLNGDGVKDLISGEYSGMIYYCQNNGTNADPQLANMVTLKTGTINIDHGSTARIAVIDWDQDGTMDIVSGGYDSRLRLYLQAPSTDPAPTIVLTRLSGYSIPGGTYCDYNVVINNPSPSSVTYDAWSDVQMPDDSFYGPIILREMTTAGYGTENRNPSQYVPVSAPNGYYYYYGYVGNYDVLQVFSSSNFYFYKLSDDNIPSGGDEWTCEGWEDQQVMDPYINLPSRIQLSASPNPFNPTTTLRYSMPDPGQVNINVYDVSGRLVSRLADGFRSEGSHEITWDASSLPAGVYLVDFQTGQSRLTEKVVLLK